MALVFASMGDYPAIPLGSNFGALIGGPSALFSIIAYIPTGILYNLATRAGFRELISTFSPDAALFNKRDKIILRRISAFFKYALAPFAGVPFMSYTKNYLDNDLGTVIVAQIGIASFAAALKAESMLLENVFIATEIDTIKAVRNTLNYRIKQAIKSIQSLTPDQLAAYYQSFMDRTNAALTEQEIVDKFKLLLNPPKPPENIVVTIDRKTLPTLYTRTTAFISLGLGFAAMYAYKTGAQVAAEWFCNTTGITGDDKENIKTATGLLAVSINTIFCSIYALKKINKFSEDVINKDLCPTGASVTATSFSLGASTMNAVIAIESGNNPILIAPTVIMTAAMRIGAFEALINQCKRLYHNHRFPTQPVTQRANLIHLLVSLQMALDLMDATCLFSMEQASRIVTESLTPSRVRFHYSESPRTNETEINIDMLDARQQNPKI